MARQPGRPATTRRQGRRAARRPLITTARIFGLLLMIASVAAIGWLITSDDYALDESRLELSGLRYTDPTTVRATAGIPAGSAPNVFALGTRQMERALEALPAVADADVHVVLPERLVVAVTERQPVLVVRWAGESFLVDAEGVVLQEVAGANGASASLPAIDDRRRTLGTEVGVGGSVDPTDLAAMLQLAAVTAQTLESDATSVALSIDDENGFVMTADPPSWRAVFGHYTATLRPPDMIARQVQCLRSLLAEGEANIETIYLAPLDERCGTYVPRTTPRRTPSPSPSG